MKLRNIFLLLLLPIMVGTFNILVNPFDQWNIPRLKSISEKITETRWDSLIKSYQIEHGNYDTVILGSSRAAIALSPTHPVFASQNVYNSGLSGAGIYLQYLELQHAIATQPIKNLVITPDFFGFNAFLALNQPALHGQPELIEWMTDETGVNAIKKIPQALGDTFANTLGWRGTNSSLRTLISQEQKTVYIDRQGYWNRFGTKDRNFAAQYDRTERVFLTELLFPSPEKKYAFNDTNSGYDSFVIYQKMLMLAHQHNIQVHIIILPTPARDLLALQILGQWSNYIHWKKMLVDINESTASDIQASPFPVWDFETINNIESDHIEDLKPFFFEPFHPTPLVGGRILEQVFGNCTTPSCWPGQLLTSGNVSLSLTTMDEEFASYRSQHPQQLASLMENINKTNAYRNTKE